MNKTRWTYCKTILPTRNDFIYLSRIINYHKRQMWAMKDEVIITHAQFVTAQLNMSNHIDMIEGLSEEYADMAFEFFKEYTTNREKS